MLKILIVEGNNLEIIERNHSEGINLASDCYQNALALHAPNSDFDITAPFAPQYKEVAPEFDQYDGIVLTGSGVAWCATDKEAKPYMDYLDLLLNSNKPILGSCWGVQTAAVALGGKCGSNIKGTEAGIAKDIELTMDGKAHPIFTSMPGTFSSPCIHRDHITELPNGATHLARNEVSEVQAMGFNQEGIDFFGVQFHPELEIEYINLLLKRRGLFSPSRNVILNQPVPDDDSIYDPLQRTKILGNWLKHVTKKKMAA